MAAAYAGIAAVALAPIAGQFLSKLDSPAEVGLMSGFDARGTAEIGSNSLARGGLLGASPDLIQPSSTGDPSSLITTFGGGAGYRGAGPRSVGQAHNGVSARRQSEFVQSEPQAPDFNTEGYDRIAENEFRKASDHPLSTFSIDVDKASYANVRRFITAGGMPPKDAVRVEELINYFSYDYPEPRNADPLSITLESAACPWNDAHKLVRIGLKAKELPKDDLPPSNLVFLIDTSGSMSGPGRLELIQRALPLLVSQLREEDSVALVAYAGSAGLVLPSTSGADKRAILSAIERLSSGGGTAGGAGIELAYKVAAEGFKKKGNNRVILATDGDFNLGVSSDGELTRLIEAKRSKGIFLSVLGFGTGNYQDAKMEKLADNGDGNYAYIDDILEANKVLVQEMGGTLFTVAKDVKVQVEFNPGRVSAYRLLGYENRLLKSEDFNNDKKDAGEMGSGHTVTALYEVVPAGVKADVPGVDPLKYQKTSPVVFAGGNELLTVKFRYKAPDGDKSRLVEKVLEDEDRPWSRASEDFRFAASVAGFGMLLRGSTAAGDLDYDKLERMAKGAVGKDADGYRKEFVGLIGKARSRQ
ncbi:MAG: VWA domain-containing protein [Elusimicrobia bacterium]|nr:VWA domain-containing protein [Elusimicrobiota bacterium]